MLWLQPICMQIRFTSCTLKVLLCRASNWLADPGLHTAAVGLLDHQPCAQVMFLWILSDLLQMPTP